MLQRRFTVNWASREWRRFRGPVDRDVVVHQSHGDRLRVFVGDMGGWGTDASTTAPTGLLIRPMIAREMAMGLGAETFRRWSEVIDQLFEDRVLAFCCLDIDFESGLSEVINGGNPPVVVRRDDGRRYDEYRSDGMPLGLVGDDGWRAPSLRQTVLSSGDEISCYVYGPMDTMNLRPSPPSNGGAQDRGVRVY